jgi:putative ABC transport system ATP-binding protein
VAQAISRETAVDLRGIEYAWHRRRQPVLALDQLQVGRGERLFLRGPSGSGKTSLLGIIGGVLIPQRGQVTVLGKSLSLLRPAARDRFRADHVGFIFQMFNLVPYLTPLENVLLPLAFSALRRDRVRASGALAEEAQRLVAALGLDPTLLKGRRVGEMSVGQQQRVAAARALIGRPEIVIADEPTSALDSEARESFLNLLFKECAASGATLIFVSHDPQLVPLFDRSLDLTLINRAMREA